MVMIRKIYVVSINSSLGGLFERLDDMNINWAIAGCGLNFVEIEIVFSKERMVEVENEMVFYT